MYSWFMILNISSDRVVSISQWSRDVLPYGELEKHLPDFLDNNLDVHKSIIKNILIINGPWSFTNLRIVTLALNTYNMLHDFSYQYISINKIDFYHALYVWWKCKKNCIMYIWQKKNFRLVDCEHKTYHKIHLDDIATSVQWLSDNRFVDDMVAEWKEAIEKCLEAVFPAGSIDDRIYTIFWWEEAHIRDVLWNNLHADKMIEPYYMIDANIDK